MTEMARGGAREARPRERRFQPSRVLSYLVMAGIVVGILFPLVPIALWSVTYRWFYPRIIPSNLSLRAWSYVFSPASQAANAAVTGGIIALVATVVSLLIGIPGGRALGLHRFRGKKVVEFLILAPVIVPSLAVLMGMHVVFIRLGLTNPLGVMLAHLVSTTPYVVMVMSSVFANYEPEYEEQARTLGAGPLRTFWHVTLPAIFPGLIAAGMFAFIISWGQYIVTLLISGGKVITVPLLLVTFAGSANPSVTAALCVLFVAPSVVYIILGSRYLTGENAALGGFGR